MAAAAAVALSTTAAWSLPAAAQDAGSRETRDFVQAAGESDAFELMEAHSALAQSTDPEVLDYARRMIRDHEQTGRSLTEAVAQAGVSPPKMAVGASQAPLLAALQSARGPDFDRLYWRHQALAHRSALVTAQGYAASGDAPPVRAAAVAAVPIIERHLAVADAQMARSGGS